MSLPKHHLELLSPARDVTIAREAILHGADAVYIGGPSFGARHNACNEVSDIAELVKFAHRYHARIFTTINTILHDDELEPARKLIHQLYDAGVDALIVQDLGVMEMDIPPIELHASTQTDIRTLSRAKFLDQAGFSQLVLARELNLQEIRAIADETDAAIEFFIHGALCVAFSGQCNISHAQNGRSANRGDCSQACRLPYTLKDDQGRVVAFEKHLLSMKDNNQSANLRALVDAGVRSFKIEGRYKDAGYVKTSPLIIASVWTRFSKTARTWHVLPAAVPRTFSCRTRKRPFIAAAPIISSATARSTSARSTRRPSLVWRWAPLKSSASAI